MKRKTNPRISLLVRKLNAVSKAQKVDMWKTVARNFESPSRNWAEVNLSKLNRLAKENETVLVPGKVLGAGIIDHPVKVYAFSASAGAKKLIKDAKGSIGTIEELIEKNPKGTGIRILK